MADISEIPVLTLPEENAVLSSEAATLETMISELEEKRNEAELTIHKLRVIRQAILEKSEELQMELPIDS
jgi:hypothetical protein|tara:strand:- start:6574 stop:6783 length:210 start_codon:yes stop_codon:yes gene_type:complete